MAALASSCNWSNTWSASGDHEMVEGLRARVMQALRLLPGPSKMRDGLLQRLQGLGHL